MRYLFLLHIHIQRNHLTHTIFISYVLHSYTFCIGLKEMADEEDNQDNNQEQDEQSRDEHELPTNASVFTYLLQSIRNKDVHKMRSKAPLLILRRYHELCLPIIVGKQHWKINHANIGVRSLVTTADEALMALVLENNIEEWVVLARGGEINGRQWLTLYTHGGQDAKGTWKGWSLQGRKRFNKLFQEVKVECNAATVNNIEERLKVIWKCTTYTSVLQMDTMSTDISSQDTEREEEEFQPAFNFDDQ